MALAIFGLLIRPPSFSCEAHGRRRTPVPECEYRCCTCNCNSSDNYDGDANSLHHASNSSSEKVHLRRKRSVPPRRHVLGQPHYPHHPAQLDRAECGGSRIYSGSRSRTVRSRRAIHGAHRPSHRRTGVYDDCFPSTALPGRFDLTCPGHQTNDRQSYLAEHLQQGFSGIELTKEVAHHTAHCFDYIRQGIMCNADTSLEGSTEAGPGWGSEHVCKDYDAVLEWANKHGAMAWRNELLPTEATLSS